MSAGLAGFLLLAVIDSINPSALVVTLDLLGRGAPARAILVYIAAIFVAYFAAGIVLLLGLTALFEPLAALLETRTANVLAVLLGGGMLAYALAARNAKNAPPPPKRLEATSLALGGLFVLGVTVTVLELPTALPYLAAIGILTSEDLSLGRQLPLLALYSAIFVLPPLLLMVGYRFLGRGGGDRLARRLRREARETMLWIVGIVGFYLLFEGLRSFGVFGSS